MTVQVSDRLSQLYVGNGINTRFDFTFRAFEQEDETGIGVRVKVGNDFEFIDESEYAVTLNPDNLGGYVTFVEPPSAVTFFYIAGKTPVDQLLDITNYDNFYPDAIERALDKLTAILQEWKHLVDFETQARILADIDYDELAKQREADLKAYIDGIASSIIGQPVVGLPSQFVTYGAGTQRDFNDAQVLLNSAQQAFNDKYNKFKQPETGAVERDLSVRARDIQYVDDYSSVQNAFNAKRSSTSVLTFGLKPYIITGSLSLTAYHYITGCGFNSDIRFSGVDNGLIYTAGTGIQDDHAHRVIADLQIRGDNTGAGYLGPKTGKTIGYSVDTTGHYAETRGLLLNGHKIGMKLRKTYTNSNQRNYYRACLYGLWLEDITSHREVAPYFRYNDIAAMYVSGSTQNVTVEGGAIEGNIGRAVWAKDLLVDTSFPKLTFKDVYFESNGNLAANIPAVDIQDHPKLHVIVEAGSLWNNVLSGITTGVYKWGRSASFNGSSINGFHYGTRLSVKNCTDAALYNSSSILATDQVTGLSEPAMMMEYTPVWRGNGIGPVFQVACSGRSGRKLLIANEAILNYPHISNKSTSVTTTENTGLNYGDGSWTDIGFSVSGSYDNDYAQLASLTDTLSEYPNKVFVFLLKPVSDCQIGIIAAGTGTQNSAYFALKAGKTYRMCCFANRVSAGDYRVRIFSINGAATISYLPIHLSKFKDFQEAVNMVNMFCNGSL
ncbi:hypothetical protein WBV54_09655 [Acinetobacter baumannii]